MLERGRRFAEQATRLAPVRCVVVIGSVARGTHGPRSDVDLVVVLNRVDDRVYARLKTLAADVIGLPVDLIALTPSQLRAHALHGTRFHRELTAGVTVYDDGACGSLLGGGGSG